MSNLIILEAFMEPGEENGEVRYNVEPGDEHKDGVTYNRDPGDDIPTPADPEDSANWFEDY